MKANNVNMIRTGMTVLVAMSLTACSRCTVIEANRNIDPIPSEISKEQQTVAKDAYADKQWNLSKVGISEDGAREQGSARVTVAVLGTGVDYNHEDLRANMIVNQKEMAALNAQGFPVNWRDDDGNGIQDDFIGWDIVDWDGLPFDMVGDETAAAGIIGASTGNGKGVAGISPSVSMIPVRYINGDGATSTWDFIDALEYTTNYIKPDVVYLHLPALDLSYTRYLNDPDPEIVEIVKEIRAAEASAIQERFQRLADRNIPVVINAGARGADINAKTANDLMKIVLAAKSSILVTSVDANDKRPSIANYGIEHVLTSAPGVNVYSTLPGNQYGFTTGTHLAAAHVAGALALGYSKYYGKVTLDDVKYSLATNGGDDIITENNRLETIGRNRINVGKFLADLGARAK